MLVIWIPLSGGVLFGVERFILKADVVEVTGIFENSKCFICLLDKKILNRTFLCFLMLMIRMPETAKIRITIQVKDLYIADDVLYYVLD